MLINNQHPLNKSIMASVLGVPNVGKSSLINHFLGFDLSIVTHRAQTTRNRFHCVFTVDHTEIILVDTPGLHRSNKEFNKRLNQQAREGIEGSDLNLLLIDLNHPIVPQFQSIVENIKGSLGPSWAIFTKSDLHPDIDKWPIEKIVEEVKKIIPSLQKYFVLSSKTGDNVSQLTKALCARAQSGPHHYSEGSLSNKRERFFVMEYIREQLFLLLKEEIPYEMAVIIDDFEDLSRKNDRDNRDNRDNRDGKEKVVARINATIMVNRPSQRAIVVGSKGAVIREVGIRARQRIEKLLEGKIYLGLHVKVVPRWFKNNAILEKLHLPRAINSHRVWRKR